MAGHYEYVLNDIKAVVDTAKANGILVKVIQESGFLSPVQIAKACELSYEAGADFVKTSTGFGPGGAKPEYIDIMVKTVGGKMSIKASGGIRDRETAVAFLKQGAHRLGLSDIEAVLARDPAARSTFEVITCYPGYRAIRRHRRAHALWVNGFKWLARYLSMRTARKTGIDIHPGAVIGNGLFIDHGNGVVIGETTVIGDDVTIYQGVTLGGTGKDTGKRHPTIGDRVVIGAGAKVLGPFTVGDDSKIGAGAIVLREVSCGSTVVGNPGRVVRVNGVKTGIDLDLVNLPDPVKDRIEVMTERINQLERCLLRGRSDENCERCPDSDGPHCAKTKGELRHADL